jgi:hypothetical protein
MSNNRNDTNIGKISSITDNPDTKNINELISYNCYEVKKILINNEKKPICGDMICSMYISDQNYSDK